MSATALLSTLIVEDETTFAPVHTSTASPRAVRQSTSVSSGVDVQKAAGSWRPTGEEGVAAHDDGADREECSERLHRVRVRWVSSWQCSRVCRLAGGSGCAADHPSRAPSFMPRPRASVTCSRRRASARDAPFGPTLRTRVLLDVRSRRPRRARRVAASRGQVQDSARAHQRVCPARTV